MSKKMKRVAGETPPPPYGGGGGGGGLYGDVKARVKHQALLQEYQDLQKDTYDMRNKVDAAKQKKLRLLAEIRFLRRRYEYLLKMKSLNCPQKQPQTLEKQLKLPPLPKPKPKGKMHSGKKAVKRNSAPSSDSNHGQALDVGKKATHFSSTPVSELNLRRRIASGEETAVLNSLPAVNSNQIRRMQSRTSRFDLDQDNSLISGTGHRGNEATLYSQAPTFDLNEISTEEEQHNNYEKVQFEESKIGLIRGRTLGKVQLA